MLEHIIISDRKIITNIVSNINNIFKDIVINDKITDDTILDITEYRLNCINAYHDERIELYNITRDMVFHIITKPLKYTRFDMVYYISGVVFTNVTKYRRTEIMYDEHEEPTLSTIFQNIIRHNKYIDDYIENPELVSFLTTIET